MILKKCGGKARRIERNRNKQTEKLNMHTRKSVRGKRELILKIGSEEGSHARIVTSMMNFYVIDTSKLILKIAQKALIPTIATTTSPPRKMLKKAHRIRQ